MFDNIIGHRETIALLESQLAAGSFPRAVLFHGPAYSAKLSTALEAARVLCCLRGTADWSCPCASCERHRILTHPDLLLLGSRSFDVEMAASAEVLRRTGAQAARYLFVRAVRKLLRRFDPALWDAESAEGRRVLSQAAAVEDLIEALPPCGPGRPRPGACRNRPRLSSRRRPSCSTTCARPASRSSRSAAWPSGRTWRRAASRKVAIIEGAEAINESARNALLKLLEEPPDGVTLILTTTRRGAIMPTIVSRLRPYPFGERSSAEQAEVLRRIFREESGRVPAAARLLSRVEGPEPGRAAVAGGALRGPARRRRAAARADGVGLQELIGELAQGGWRNGRSVLRLLRGAARRAASAGCPGPKPGFLVLERWNALVREAADYARLYNPGASLQLESLYYRMRAAA